MPSTSPASFTGLHVISQHTDISDGDTTTSKVPLIYLSDDKSLGQQPAYVAGKWIDNIYVPMCSTLGIVGNLLAFLVLVCARSKGTTYVYMACLSLSDSLVQLVNVLFFARKFPGHETIHEGTCQLVMFFMYYGTHCSVAVMVTMTVERYLVLRYPLKATVWFTVRRAVIVVVIECALAFALDVQHLIIRRMYRDESTGQSFCQTHPGYTTYYAQRIWPWVDGALYCYIPLLCLVVFNVLIIRQIRSSSKFQSQPATVTKSATMSSAAPQSSQASSQQAQLTRMLLLVTVTFVICVTPMAIIIVVERYFWLPTSVQGQAAYYLVRVICNNLVFTNHALNFFLYCVSGKRFRHDLQSTFSCFCPARVKSALSGKIVRDAFAASSAPHGVSLE